MKRAAAYIASHRKWITGAALTAAASVCGYAWPDKPWLVTVISTLAVGLGVNIVSNRESPTAPGSGPESPAAARSAAR